MQKQTISLSEMFRSYEQDYKIHMESIMYDLLKMSKDSHGETNNQLNKISDTIQQTEQCLKQMELEAATLPVNYKKDLMETIKQYKRDINQVERDFKQLQYSHQDEQNREQLFSDKQISQALLKQEDRLIQQSLELEGAKRVAYLTEQQANQVALTLSQQTSTLQNSISKTSYIREDLGQSNGLVNVMKNRILQKRLVVYGVFGLVGMCLLIALLSYFI